MITQEFLKNSPFAQETYQQAARSAAAEAIDYLWSIYWAHSFDGQLLADQIAAIILPILTGALPLEVDAYDAEREEPKTPVRVYPPANDEEGIQDLFSELPITQWKQTFYDCGGTYPPAPGRD